MLLRHASPHDRDPDIFHTMTSHNPAAPGDGQPIPTDHHHHHHYMENTTNDTNNNNNFDDIWGDSTTPPTLQHYHHHHHHQEVSDIPRLSAAHTNAGYRDAIALAKARTAQQGFDEGYPLGSALGARAGQLLGVLEGLAAAVGLHALGSRAGCGFEEEARRIGGLLADARRELSVQGVFEGEFFGGDGNWVYQVDAGSGVGGGEVVFADVAEAHPLLRKWSGIVRGEAERWGVDWEVLKDERGEGEEEDGREREARVRRDRESRLAAARGREALAW